MSDDLDLSACEREPIHIPGAVQPHGVLLVLDGAASRVEQASGATEAFFGQSPQACLGRGLGELAEGMDDLALSEAVTSATYVGGVRGPSGELDVMAHRAGGKLVLEFEAAAQPRGSAMGAARAVEAATAEFTAASTVGEICERAAVRFRQLTGFDRAMIYRFLADGAGSVVAEDKVEALEPFLNHRYPASDIPQQARALYLTNLMRVIPDVHYTPAALVAEDRDEPPLDMSECGLRSVSPVHLQYLKNMQVGASASVSIVKDGALWGLVALHHRTPRTIPFDVRALCRLMAGVLAQQIARREDAELYAQRLRSRAAEDELLSGLHEAGELESALERHIDDLLRIAPAHGAAVRLGDRVTTTGRCPPEAHVLSLADWLRAKPAHEAFATDSLSRLFAPASVFADTASGLLAIDISGGAPHQLMWFRAEQVEVVNWAGNPHKPVDEAAGALTPRKSFELWRETVRERAEPWSVVDVEAAERLRRAVQAARRSEGVHKLNETLTRALTEQESLVTEKERLLKEGDHRIQNSLQVIASMFAMQLRQTEDASVRRQLEEAVSRLQAVGIVHRRLRRADQARFVEFDTYLTELIAELGKSLGEPWRRQLTLRVSPLVTPTEVAVSLGLLVTELVLNAVKHAYRYEPGPIEVEAAAKNGSIQVSVRDRGAAGAGAEAGSGFGSRLISGMLARLKGRMERVEAHPGLRVVLTAPLPAPEPEG